MRVSREQAAENRDRIIDAAGRLFRERGFDGIGVANLMKAAGLTHGGFYGHFESKEDLEVQACARVLARTSERWHGDGRERCRRRRWTASWTAICPAGIATAQAKAASTRRWPRMSPGRRSPACAARFTEGLRSLIDTLVRIIPGRSRAARRQKALACLSAMVGALILARAVDDAELSDEILAAARALWREPS